MPSSRNTARLTFGIYPGSAAGDDTGRIVSGPPDDPARILGALDELQGVDRHPLVVRAYRIFADTDDRDRRSPAESPLAPARYTGQGRSLDLVVQYQSRRGDVAGYCSFLRSVVADHGSVISTLQIGEEPNVTNNPGLDGSYPAGPAGPARGRHRRRLGPAPPGRARPGRARRHPPADHRARVAHRPRPAARTASRGHPNRRDNHRRQRPAARPCRVHHFALRDADSQAPGLFSRFGLMTDDYTPKPAFSAYRELIDSFSI